MPGKGNREPPYGAGLARTSSGPDDPAEALVRSSPVTGRFPSRLVPAGVRRAANGVAAPATEQPAEHGRQRREQQPEERAYGPGLQGLLGLLRADVGCRALRALGRAAYGAGSYLARHVAEGAEELAEAQSREEQDQHGPQRPHHEAVQQAGAGAPDGARHPGHGAAGEEGDQADKTGHPAPAAVGAGPDVDQADPDGQKLQQEEGGEGRDQAGPDRPPADAVPPGRGRGLAAAVVAAVPPRPGARAASARASGARGPAGDEDLLLVRPAARGPGGGDVGPEAPGPGPPLAGPARPVDLHGVRVVAVRLGPTRVHRLAPVHIPTSAHLLSFSDLLARPSAAYPYVRPPRRRVPAHIGPLCAATGRKDLPSGGRAYTLARTIRWSLTEANGSASNPP